MNAAMNAVMTASAAVVRVEGEFTIYRAAELKPALLVGGDGPLEIDLGAVTEIDTAGVQLLLLAQREARAVSRPFRLTGASPAVREGLALLGLAQRLAIA
jgi:anti-anti-sigma factor